MMRAGTGSDGWGMLRGVRRTARRNRDGRSIQAGLKNLSCEICLLGAFKLNEQERPLVHKSTQVSGIAVRQLSFASEASSPVV